MKGQRIKRMAHSILSVAAGLAIGVMVGSISGDSPGHIAWVIVKGAFGGWEACGYTLLASAPIALAGLSVAFALKGGLFNVGAEGQLMVGALGAAAVAALWPGLPAPFAPVLAAFAAIACGAGWGGIAGVLRARRGSHEVIVTLMLNFIAAGLVSYLVLHPLKNTESQNPETSPIAPGYSLSVMGCMILIPILVAAMDGYFKKSRQGFELGVVGESESVAQCAGISVPRMQILALSGAGALAGLVGAFEVLAVAGKLRLGFSPGYGFTGIAVALLAGGSPWGVLVAALLFGALHQGTANLDLETEHVTRDLALVIQACVIFAIARPWSKLTQRG